MRIVNRETFLSLPEGTIFSKYEPCIFGDLCIKYDTSTSGNDFWYVPLASSIDCDGSDDFVTKCHLALESEAPMIFDAPYRDGDPTAEDQLFSVWSKEDVEKLIDTLRLSLG